MEKRIITVSREFGSGGRTIGRMVAERLGYKFFDDEIIERVVRECGLSREIVEKYDEYATHRNSLLYTLAVNTMGDAMHGLSFANQVQIAQSKVIKEIADEGNCVIIGRGADYILRDRSDCFNVFVRADMDSKVMRIEEIYGKNDKKTEDRIKDKDTKRRVFYRSFTMREWGDIANYNLVLDSGVIGLEKCAEIICDAARSAKK